jgi:hypothetical protein
MSDSIGVVPAGPPAIAPLDGDADPAWTMSLAGADTTWDWSSGSPDPRAMGPVRRPRSSSASRHIPVEAYSATTRGPIRLESGLEHDLLRWLDRRPEVVWLVAQPLRLTFRLTGAPRPVAHTPDLLSVDRDGTTTVWDVRERARQDEKFTLMARLTRDACHRAGWAYRVFGGLDQSARLNVMWLHGFRRPQPWYPQGWARLTPLIAGGCTIGAVLSADTGAGHLVSTMWHHLWAGDLTADLDAPLTADTVVRPSVEAPL